MKNFVFISVNYKKHKNNKIWFILGQNVNSYRDLSCGQDLKDPTKQSAGFKTVYKPKLGGLRFYELLDKVSLINPEMRIRFTSPHPKDFPDEVNFTVFKFTWGKRKKKL